MVQFTFRCNHCNTHHLNKKKICRLTSGRPPTGSEWNEMETVCKIICRDRHCDIVTFPYRRLDIPWAVCAKVLILTFLTRKISISSVYYMSSCNYLIQFKRYLRQWSKSVPLRDRRWNSFYLRRMNFQFGGASRKWWRNYNLKQIDSGIPLTDSHRRVLSVYKHTTPLCNKVKLNWNCKQCQDLDH